MEKRGEEDKEGRSEADDDDEKLMTASAIYQPTGNDLNNLSLARRRGDNRIFEIEGRKEKNNNKKKKEGSEELD